MATKAIRARLIDVSPRLDRALRRTHRVFNIALAQMITRYIDMRKGKMGTECRQIVRLLLGMGNQAAHGIMDQLTRDAVSSDKDYEWVQLARRRHGKDGPLFLQREAFAVLDGRKVRTSPPSGSGVRKSDSPDALIVTAEFWRQVCDDASAFLKSYQALLEDWREKRQEWLDRRAAWQAGHPDFMAFWNGPYAEFERECDRGREEAQAAAGQRPTTRKRPARQRGKRVSRWRLWYEWILAHPETVAWRGRAEPSDFRTVPAEVARDIKSEHRRQDRQISAMLDWIREQNPELRQLDNLRRLYVREFLRFPRAPTLTLPSPDRHPRHFSLERGVFYRNFDPETGEIQMRLIDEDESGVWFMTWMPARLHLDPRLRPSHRAEVFRREGRLPPYIPGKPGRKLNRPAATAGARKAGYAGAKLILRPRGSYLMFTVIDQDEPPRVRPTKVKGRTCSADNMRSADGQRIPLRVVGIDLGVRNLGAYVVAEGRWGDGQWLLRDLEKGVIRAQGIPSLGGLRGHERQLRAARRRRGKPVAGERSFISLQDHRTHMADDRFKKGARAIVDLARRSRAHIVLFEKLDSLKPTAFSERWLNRQLREMNRRRIVEAVRMSAPEFGILVDDGVNPYLTSRVCSRCHRPGFRFSMKRKNPRLEGCGRLECREYGYPEWDRGGRLFRCPHCGYRVNADINAASNLLAKFFGLWRDVGYKDGVYRWQEDGAQRELDARAEFDTWAAGVRRRAALRGSPF